MIVSEIRLANNKYFLTALYRSSSQNKDQYDALYRSSSQNKDQYDERGSSFNIIMSNINDEKPLASIITEDFHARSKN